MNMKRILLRIIFSCWTITVLAQDKPVHVDSRGVVLMATNANNTLELLPAPTNTVHWFVLAEFSIERREADYPQKITLSGTIKDKNAWFPAEQMPLYFDSDLQPPRLAAITDSHGKFSFNVTLKEDNRSGELECSAITNGAIYVGNANIYSVDSFDNKRMLKTGFVRKYTLAELLPLFQQKH